FEVAHLYILSLHKMLYLKPEHKILDLASRKGRHSIYMNSIGLDVVGVDLSPHNIAEAKKAENDRLHFYVHDMREVFRKEGFDFVLNLFTSFGYFETEEIGRASCRERV